MSTNVDTESIVKKHNADLQELNNEMNADNPEVANEARTQTAGRLLQATKEGRDAVNGRTQSEKKEADKNSWQRAIRGFCKALFK